MPKNPKEKKHFCTKLKKDGKPCCAGFARPYNLMIHVRIHTGEKPEKCHCIDANTGTVCGIGFVQRSALKRHIGSEHNNEKKHVCEHVYDDGSKCVESFNRTEHLEDHMMHHTGLYHSFCSHPNDEGGGVCGKGCTTAAHLADHVMTNHTDKNSPEYKEYREHINQRKRERYAKDVEVRVSVLMRAAFHNYMKKHGGKTAATAYTQFLVGCTWDELVEHLHNNSRGLTLDTPGIHIDHIRPMCSFNNKNANSIEQHRCMNFNNLQLLPGDENRRKGGDYDVAKYELTDASKAIEKLVPGWVAHYRDAVGSV
jgi:hypothetical protein